MWTKENRCRRKSESGFWGGKKGWRSSTGNQSHSYSVTILWERWSWPLLNASPHCWGMIFSYSSCPPAAHSASAENIFLCWVLPRCLKQPYAVQRPKPIPGSWTQTPSSMSITEAPVSGGFPWKGEWAGWNGWLFSNQPEIHGFNFRLCCRFLVGLLGVFLVPATCLQASWGEPWSVCSFLPPPWISICKFCSSRTHITSKFFNKKQVSNSGFYLPYGSGTSTPWWTKFASLLDVRWLLSPGSRTV